ncbi:MAG: hypothetical protein U9R38_06470 [Candidatus Margulisiibacteriota bacterium]|nr:hypothetical protein [Candidatus Margulisiibacteriota bacterium]
MIKSWVRALRSIIFFCLIFSILVPSFPALAETYPKFDISGYKKWEYRGAKVSPGTNYFSGLTQLGGYSPTATGAPWQERLSLKILTQLSEKLTVTYDIQQEPASPDRYNVKLNYNNKHELTFGDLTATFSGNEFANTTKVLDGMMFTSRDEGHEIIIVPSSKLKSEVQGYTTQNGANTKGPYSLGHGSIIEGSEIVELNNVPLEKGKDYIIDYLEGTITFDRILNETDEFSYSYEYTNISDIFFPALSKKDFFGFQARIKTDPATWGKPIPRLKKTYLKGYEVFPSIFGEISQPGQEDIKGEEESGHYRLKHCPIALFSEILIFQGAVLSKDKDYTIRYDTGMITLLLPTLPAKENRLQVSYSYLKTKHVQEVLPAISGRGPYTLYNSDIIPCSEQVFINDHPVTPDLDYHIDYENGRLIFNYEVPKTAAIKVDYVYIVKISPYKKAPGGLKQELTVGMTYLRESAKSGLGAASATNSESLNAADIIANNNTIYLSRYPILPTEEGGSINISVGGRILTPEVDYTVPSTEADPVTGYTKVTPNARLAYINDRNDLTDGYYTGTIKLLATIEATQEVSVNYTYRRSIISRHTGTGNGGRGPYYIRGYRNLVPGSENVEVWDTGSADTTVYTRNSSFEMDAGDLGYSINYYKDTPYITFNRELGPEKSYSAHFQYIPPAGPIGNNIKQDITGFDAEYELGDILKFTGNFATSKTDNVTVSEHTIEAVSFIPPTHTVSVIKHNTPAIIDGTEKVYVNNYLRNRDIDYIIDYETGTINFFYITLGTPDAVVVEYDYPDPGGIARVGETVDIAYKYGLETNLGDLTMKYSERAIGLDFTPLGGTAIGPGTSRRDLSANYTRANLHDLTMGFAYIENNSPVSGSRESFNRSFDRSYNMGFNPFGWAGISMGLRNVENKGDPLTTGGSYSAHSETNEYNGSFNPAGLNFGPISYVHSYNGSLTDGRDFLANTFSRNKYFHLTQGVGLTKRIKGGLDWQFNEPYTISGYRTSQEALTSKSTTKDLGYNLALDLTHGTLEKWIAYAKLLEHKTFNYFSTTEGNEVSKNVTYHTDLVPINILALSYDLTRSEKPTVIVEGKNPMSETGTTKVELSPLDYLSTGWVHTEDMIIHDTGRESSGNSDNYSGSWNVFTFEKASLDTSFGKYYRVETAPSGSIEAVTTTTDSFSQNYSLTLSPAPVISITPVFSKTNYQFTSTIDSPLQATAQTTGIGIDYTPESPFSASANYDLKITSIPTVSPRHKANLGIDAGYKVLDWGKVTVIQDEEYNGGEVLAGGMAPDIDYIKKTRTINIEFTVPQDNPVISAIVFNLAYKTVSFDNRLPGGDKDDLHAQMVTFDGTLNF